MKKTIVSLFVVILVILGGIIPVQASTATATLNSSKTVLIPGETFTVALSIACQDGINGVIGLTYSYDTSKLELVSERVGTNFSNIGENNVIDLISNSSENITNADVYILEFKVKESIKSATTANISIGEMMVDSNASTNSEATVTVQAKTVDIIILGDANFDGSVDIKDILAINKHRLNKAKLTGNALIAADVNKDGQVDIKDILQINKYRLGKISSL